MRYVEHKFGTGQLGYVGPGMEVDSKAFDDERRSVRWTLSQETPDRARMNKRGKPDGDIVRVKGIDFRDYKRNPVLLQFHDYQKHSIGIVEDTAVEGNRFRGTPVFNPPDVGNRDADIIWGQVRAGHHRAGSIGFIATKAVEMKGEDEDDDPYGYRPRDFQKIYLLEFSMTPVPMLQTALVEGRDAEYSLTEVARDLVGYNPHLRNADDIADLVEQFGENLLTAWTETRSADGPIETTETTTLKTDGGDPPTADGEHFINLGELLSEADARKSVEEIAKSATSKIRARYAL